MLQYILGTTHRGLFLLHKKQESRAELHHTGSCVAIQGSRKVWWARSVGWSTDFVTAASYLNETHFIPFRAMSQSATWMCDIIEILRKIFFGDLNAPVVRRHPAAA